MLAAVADSQSILYLPPQTELWPTQGMLTSPTAGDSLNIALQYLKSNASQFGLSRADFDYYKVTNRYTDADGGVTHIYLQQTYRGLPVANALANINISADGRVINAAVSFVPGLSSSQNTGAAQPAVGAAEAFSQFAQTFDLTLTGTPTVVAVLGGLEQTQEISSAGVTQQNITAGLEYVATPAGVELAWAFNVEMLEAGHSYDVLASAADGSLLRSTDRVKMASYNVLAPPLMSPYEGTRTIVVDPSDPAASPYGWHDVNGLPGADFFDTRGNNVFVQEDVDGLEVARDPNVAGSVAVGNRPSGGASLTFDFPVNFAQPPVNYQDASLTNLFYWVNYAHDVLYHYGFNEAAGNFQMTNYTGLGLGNDPIHAFGQALTTIGPFFYPTPDGTAPILCMSDNSMFVTGPLRDADFDTGVIVHELTHGLTTRLVGGPANYTVLSSPQGAGIGEGLSDFVALMFHQKATTQKNDAVAIANYFFGYAPNGPGIRNYPYSYDMTIDPNTIGIYNAGQTAAQYYDYGQAFASALWDLNWLLIDKYGYDANLATGKGGNNMALQLLVDTLKLVPAEPSFLQFRNAMLAADLTRNKGVNQKEIWQAFARRGMGFSANDGGIATSTRVTEAFDMPANPGIVTGVVWSDANNNALFDATEAGLANWTVFIDLNSNGVLDTYEPTTRTDASGSYAFEFYTPGTFTIGMVVEPDYTQTYPPAPGTQTTTVGSGQTVSDVNFGARPGKPQSAGVVWNDLNANGRRDAGEPGIPNVWVYVDLDGDRRLDLPEPKAVSALDGTYSLTFSQPGTYYVRTSPTTAGWVQTFPGGAEQGHRIVVGQATLNVNFNFGLAKVEDYGDAPASYGTLAADNGAVHPILAGFCLGTGVDGEADGTPAAGADGDDSQGVLGDEDDEDGVVFTSFLYPGAMATANVTATVGTNGWGRLNAWIDFNRDGQFGADEKIISDQWLDDGTYPITFAVPGTAQPGLTYARFRFGYQPNLGPTGRDIAGEVEDYTVRILSTQPDAVDDQYTVPLNAAFTVFPVLANDIPSPNGILRISPNLVSLPDQGGTVIVAADGLSLQYRPKQDFFGTETFTYQVYDEATPPRTDTAVVTVTVEPLVQTFAVDDTFRLPNGQTETFDVLANDFKGSSQGLSQFTILLPPQFGVAAIDDRGTASLNDDRVLYTPTQADITDTFTYMIADGNGVQSAATVTVHIGDTTQDDKVEYRLQVFSLQGAPLQAVGVGQEFLLRVSVKDLRPDDGSDDGFDWRGVAAGYLDVLYNYRLVSVAGSIVHSNEYSLITEGDTSVPGLLDEVGGFQSGGTPLGTGYVPLFSIPLKATAAGTVDFVGDPANLISPSGDGLHETLLYEPPSAVGLQQIRFGSASLQIVVGAPPVAIDNTFTVQSNTTNNVLNVLGNDLESVNLPLTVTSVQTTTDRGGTASISADGLNVIYTPPTPQFVGTDQFTYTATNAAGLSATATVSVQVVSNPATPDKGKGVSVLLEATDLNGNPITSVQQGGSFQLRAYVQDIRDPTMDPNVPADNLRGVFAAYFDLLYDSALVSTIDQPITNPDDPLQRGFEVVYGEKYRNGPAGSDAVPNVIDELGAFQTGLDPLGTGRILLAAVTFRADQPGIAEFVADPADIAPDHDTLYFQPPIAVGLDAISLHTTTITVIAQAGGEWTYTNPANPLDVNNDNRVSPLDALWVVNAASRRGIGKLPLLAGAAGEGESARMPAIGFVDVNGDGSLTPLDALRIINYLNRGSAGGSQAEGEGESAVAAPLAVAQSSSATAPASDTTGLWGSTLVQPTGAAVACATASSNQPAGDISEPAWLASDSTAYQSARKTDLAIASWGRGDGDQEDAVSDDLAAAVAEVWAQGLGGL